MQGSNADSQKTPEIMQPASDNIEVTLYTSFDTVSPLYVHHNILLAIHRRWSTTNSSQSPDHRHSIDRPAHGQMQRQIPYPRRLPPHSPLPSSPPSRHLPQCSADCAPALSFGNKWRRPDSVMQAFDGGDGVYGWGEGESQAWVLWEEGRLCAGLWAVQCRMGCWHDGGDDLVWIYKARAGWGTTACSLGVLGAVTAAPKLMRMGGSLNEQGVRWRGGEDVDLRSEETGFRGEKDNWGRKVLVIKGWWNVGHRESKQSISLFQTWWIRKSWSVP